MRADDGSMLWTKNEEWYRINYEKDCFELTDKAPDKAVKSFELYKKKNSDNPNYRE